MKPLSLCWTLSATAVVGVVVASSMITASSAQYSDPAATGPLRVAAAAYDLGDTAFRVPGFPEAGADPTGLAPLELAGVVHYPAGPARTPRPVVVLTHGSWWTCADRAAETLFKKLLVDLDNATTDEERDAIGEQMDAPLTAMAQWPCAKGTPPLPSYRGYDYLGARLASHGIVTISVGANGVNAGAMGEVADMARAAVINKHLAMWNELSRTGRGPLAGKLTDLATGEPARADFRGRLDLTRVGTSGHSRGGRGVVWHAADVNRKDLPAGVRLRAAFPLAPAGVPLPDDGDADDAQRELVTHYQVKTTPLAYWLGTLDGATSGGPEIAEIIDGRSKTPITGFTVHGANHNFLNTQWSPSSGQMMAENDSPSTDGLLTEDAERTVAKGLLTAFFRHHLLGDRRFDGLLTGRDNPLGRVTRIDVKRHLPGEPPSGEAPTRQKSFRDVSSTPRSAP